MQAQTGSLFEKSGQLVPNATALSGEIANVHPLASRWDRTITIRTPENVEVTYPLAGLGSRAAAQFLDFLIILVAYYTVLNVMVLAFGAMSPRFGRLLRDDFVAMILTIVALSSGVLTAWGYFVCCEILFSGQTLGKWALGIRVLKASGHALGFWDVFVRNLLRIVDFMPFGYGLGAVVAALTRYGQRVGDLLAGTVVVRSEQVETARVDRLADVAATPSRPAINLPREVVNLIDEFLLSAEALHPAARQRIAAELADLVRRLTGLTPERRQSAETFLRSIVSPSRDSGAGN